jgi:phytoene/squalene synthetase
MKEASNSISRYNQLCFDTGALTTKIYSTSFYSATRLLEKEIQKAIQSIYAFVRLADEIVDTFHDFDKVSLLKKFEEDYYQSIADNISLNPVLNAFQITVKKYQIPDEYIQNFLNSMKSDLEKKEYISKLEMDQYIYGSADVVGLMCLKVFSNNDQQLFHSLIVPAMRLGSAFQKVNFLRDMKEDTEILGRIYFPQLSFKSFDENTKNDIVSDIETNFQDALGGIKRLPGKSKLAVYVAYKYYSSLLKKIKNASFEEVSKKRIRISDAAKLRIFITSYVKFKLKLL